MEAATLGLARVLEILTEKLSHRCMEISMVKKLSSLFPAIEFFVFGNLSSHIDAVKTCSRNILSSLAMSLQRLEDQEEPNSTQWIRDLLSKIVCKPDHVKWVSFSCVAKVTNHSLVALDILKEASCKESLSTQLLCVARIFKNSVCITIHQQICLKLSNVI